MSLRDLKQALGRALTPSSREEGLARFNQDKLPLPAATDAKWQLTPFTVGPNACEVSLISLTQRNLYTGVGRLTSSQLSALVKSCVDSATQQALASYDLPLTMILPEGFSLEGPHTEYFPPILTTMLLRDDDRQMQVMVFGYQMGCIPELIAQLAKVDWESAAHSYAY